ncbi:hypothetical protein, partial [Pusillimonas noertemannii]|uniref:hypothetical protein n=1 Tax=Pusillimonas noertemannii TaxID=305977 RepID=UPI00333E8A8C
MIGKSRYLPYLTLRQTGAGKSGKPRKMGAFAAEVLLCGCKLPGNNLHLRWAKRFESYSYLVKIQCRWT